MNIDIVIGTSLILEDIVESNIKGLTLEDRLAFVESTNQNIHSCETVSFLRLNHLPLVGKTLSLEIAQSMSFGQVVHPRAFVVQIGQQFFAWSDMIAEPLTPLVRHTLALGQTVSVVKAKGVYDVLLISQTVEISYTRNLVLEQTLSSVSSSVAYKPDKYWTSYEIQVIEP